MTDKYNNPKAPKTTKAEKHARSMARYFQSEKGRLAKKLANQRYYAKKSLSKSKSK
jgi:hypothetical protein